MMRMIVLLTVVRHARRCKGVRSWTASDVYKRRGVRWGGDAGSGVGVVGSVRKDASVRVCGYAVVVL